MRRRSCFYTASALPQAHSHCIWAVIFLQTHLQSRLSSQMPQVVFWFLSTLPCHLLIADMAIRPQKIF